MIMPSKCNGETGLHENKWYIYNPDKFGLITHHTSTYFICVILCKLPQTLQGQYYESPQIQKLVLKTWSDFPKVTQLVMEEQRSNSDEKAHACGTLLVVHWPGFWAANAGATGWCQGEAKIPHAIQCGQEI